MIPNRLKRVNCLLQEEISAIMRENVKDPNVGFTSVTEVVTSPDLRTAKVYISVLDTEAVQEKTVEALRKGSAFIRARLRDKITLRHIPQLKFHLDHSIERGVRISRLIDEMAAELPAADADEKEEKE